MELACVPSCMKLSWGVTLSGGHEFILVRDSVAIDLSDSFPTASSTSVRPL